MTTIKKLTSDEFETLIPHLERFKEKHIDAIRRVLVAGEKQKNIAEELGLTKVAVSAKVGRAWELHLKHGERPPGWRKVEVILPPEYADVVEELAKIARKRVKR